MKQDAGVAQRITFLEQIHFSPGNRVSSLWNSQFVDQGVHGRLVVTQLNKTTIRHDDLDIVRQTVAVLTKSNEINVFCREDGGDVRPRTQEIRQGIKK